MQIEIALETEQLMQEELRSGRFRSVDDLIVASIHAWRERNGVPLDNVGEPASPQREDYTQPHNLSDLLLASPLAGANLNLERFRDYPRQIDLE